MDTTQQAKFDLSLARLEAIGYKAQAKALEEEAHSQAVDYHLTRLEDIEKRAEAKSRAAKRIKALNKDASRLRGLLAEERNQALNLKFPELLFPDATKPETKFLSPELPSRYLLDETELGPSAATPEKFNNELYVIMLTTPPKLNNKNLNFRKENIPKREEDRFGNIFFNEPVAVPSIPEDKFEKEFRTLETTIFPIKPHERENEMILLNLTIMPPNVTRSYSKLLNKKLIKPN